MNIGLLAFGKRNFPNLALMKLSAYHKNKDDKVELFDRLTMRPDKIYISVPFTWNLHNALAFKTLYPDIEICYGGSAYSYECLSDEVEHMKPDYDLYPADFSMGFTSRGCLRRCKFCIVPQKEGHIRDHAHLGEFLDDRFNKLILLDNNLLAAPSSSATLKAIRQRGLSVDFNQGLDIRLITEENAHLIVDVDYRGYPHWSRTLRFSFDNPANLKDVERGIKLLLDAGISARHLFFYILAGYNTTISQDVERVEFIAEYGARPFIMKYNRISSPELNKLAKWVNHIPYYQVVKFADFDTTRLGVKA